MAAQEEQDFLIRLLVHKPNIGGALNISGQERMILSFDLVLIHGGVIIAQNVILNLPALSGIGGFQNLRSVKRKAKSVKPPARLARPQLRSYWRAAANRAWQRKT